MEYKLVPVISLKEFVNSLNIQYCNDWSYIDIAEAMFGDDMIDLWEGKYLSYYFGKEAEEDNVINTYLRDTIKDYSYALFFGG